MSARPRRVIWRGVTLDERTAEQAKEVDRLVGDIPFRPTQGSYSTSVGASAGTHAGGGALDVSLRGLTAAQEIQIIRQGRRVGLWGWIRPAIPGKWPRHAHFVSVGCPDLSPSAKRQIEEAKKGGDGLVGGKRDPHASLGIPVRTWEQYLASKWPLPSDHVFGRRTLTVRATPGGRRVHDGKASSREAAVVKKWQRHLGVKPESGFYGPKTQEATKRLQRRLGLRQTGTLDFALARRRGIVS